MIYYIIMQVHIIQVKSNTLSFIKTLHYSWTIVKRKYVHVGVVRFFKTSDRDSFNYEPVK